MSNIPNRKHYLEQWGLYRRIISLTTAVAIFAACITSVVSTQIELSRQKSIVVLSSSDPIVVGNTDVFGVHGDPEEKSADEQPEGLVDILDVSVTEEESGFRQMLKQFNPYAKFAAAYSTEAMTRQDVEQYMVDHGLVLAGIMEEHGFCFFDVVHEEELADADDYAFFAKTLSEEGVFLAADINPVSEWSESLSDVMGQSVEELFGEDHGNSSSDYAKDLISDTLTRIYVTKNNVRVHLFPDAASDVLYTLNENNIVYTSPLCNKWSYIVMNDTLGYIETQYVSERIVPGRHFSIIGELPDDRIAFANKYISFIPDNVWETFQTHGWKLIITTEDIKSTYAPNHPVAGTFAGITQYNEKRCIIGSSEKRLRRSLLHEIGHFVDAELDYISHDAEFQEIYRKEKNNAKYIDLADRHAYSSATEFFAEGFEQFLVYPENMKETAPLTYAFMEKLIPTV